MKTHASRLSAERSGRWFSLAWRWGLRQDARAIQWIVNRGAHRRLASTLMWILKLGICAALLYAAFWMAIIVAVILIIAARGPQDDQDSDDPKWLERDPDDHREDLFYHPLPYTDEPDTRNYNPHVNDE